MDEDVHVQFHWTLISQEITSAEELLEDIKLWIRFFSSSFLDGSLQWMEVYRLRKSISGRGRGS